MELERLLPANAVRPLWSSASALVYIGGFVALFATLGLLGIAESDGGDWALVGAALVAGLVSFGLAVALQAAERAIAAGVAATFGVLFAGFTTGALLEAAGALDADIGDYQPATLLVEAVLVAASLAAIIRFRAPLLVLPAAATFWLAVTDLGSLGSWDDAGELLSIGAGAILVLGGVAVDRSGREPFGFWLHVVGGLAAGGGLAVLAGDDAWVLTALVGLGFVAVAFVLGRSSYAVLGAIGILIATTLFAADPLSLAGGVFPFFPGGPPEGESLDAWQVATSFLVAGLVLAGIGVAGRLAWPGRTGPDPAED